MGFKAWRHLSVLVLASVALVGCNNNAQKDKNLTAAPKVGDPYAKAQPNTSGQPMQNNNSPFPISPAANVNNQPKNPFQSTPGNVSNLDNKSFAPAGPALGTTPNNNPMPNFPMQPTGNGAIGQGNVISPPSPFGASNSNSISVPTQNNSGFGSQRVTVPPAPENPGSGPINVPAPLTFPNR